MFDAGTPRRVRPVDRRRSGRRHGPSDHNHGPSQRRTRTPSRAVPPKRGRKGDATRSRGSRELRRKRSDGAVCAGPGRQDLGVSAPFMTSRSGIQPRSLAAGAAAGRQARDAGQGPRGRASSVDGHCRGNVDWAAIASAHRDRGDFGLGDGGCDRRSEQSAVAIDRGVKRATVSAGVRGESDAGPEAVNRLSSTGSTRRSVIPKAQESQRMNSPWHGDARFFL